MNAARLGRLAAIASLSLSLAAPVACSAPEGEASDGPSAAVDQDIIGGSDARSASLDAVGAIMYRDPQTGLMQQLCSGTLISKDAILTAKHCAVQYTNSDADAGPVQLVETRFVDAYETYFAIGADVKTARMVKMNRVELCDEYSAGWIGVGCDVAVYRLAEPVSDVRPFKVAETPVPAANIGKLLTAIGFGAQNVKETKLGTRRAGTMTLRAVEGAPLRALYPTLDAFTAQLRKSEGIAWVQNNGDAIAQIYALDLKKDYELFVGGQGGDAQVCHGDSGGPLVMKVNGELLVYGVASAVGMSGPKLPCAMGGIYAALGPKAQELVKSSLASDPCEGIPAAGRCDGDVAVRCTDEDEGERRVVKNDCSELLLRCIPAAGAVTQVSCAD